MNTRPYYPVLLAVFMIGSVVSQNVDELPISVETDNLFPPERSESESHNADSEITTAEPTQITSEYKNPDVATSTLTNEDEKIVASTDFPPESPVEDVVASTTTADANQTTSGTTIADLTPTLVNNDAQVPNDGHNASKSDAPTSESTMSSSAEVELVTTTTIQTTSESIISDELAPALASDDSQVTNDVGGETVPPEHNELKSGPTLIDTLASELRDITNSNEGSKTTGPEPTEQTVTAAKADVLAPALASNNSRITNDEGSEINEAESNEPKSTKADTSELAFAGVMQISDDVNSESTAAETQSTQTTLGFLTNVDELALQSDEDVTANEDSETTAAETTQTSTTTIAEATTTLANTDEQNTTTEGNETTAVENEDLKSDSTIADEFTSSPTSSDSHVTNIKDSETTAESPSEVGHFSISMNAEEQATTDSSSELTCPKSCVCITEEDSSNYIVDCSDRALTDLPGPIDPKTTILKLQNNFLTIIPKEISQLKNLKVLNASYNSIFELELGSISELPELVTLNIANNRLHEYPKDLEYPLALNKLEELDLAGNDLIATPRNLLNYKALQTVILPEVSPELAADICMSLKEKSVNVCFNSCEQQSFKCSDAFLQTSDTLPGMIPFIHKMVNEGTKNVEDISANTDISLTSPIPKSTEALNSATKETKSGLQDNVPVNEFSLRSVVNNAPKEKVALQNIVIDTPTDSIKNETDVKVGAKTTETKTAGGVDKSVIAVIVAGMVIIIAVITIKKNWSSIRKRFGSTPRPNDQSVRNTNGTTPEEVPLQDKSPV